MKKLTSFQSALIWFGAGVSIAEILTGTYFAPLGFEKGLAAILTGHVIGCVMMFLAGIIGGRTRRSAMETTKMSFGKRGGVFFAALNVLQLVGWTAIMIYDGADATKSLFGGSSRGVLSGSFIWCLVIGGLILLWIAVGITNLGIINKISMSALFILSIVLSVIIFRGGAGSAAPAAGDAISFGSAVELAVAMPLSWLPLISDYTREAEKPATATAASVITYGLISVWMYVIGMGSAIYTGESNIANVLAAAGLGAAALVILILSTVTTTFLDAWSAGISAESLTESSGVPEEAKKHFRFDGRKTAFAVTILGMVLAALFNMDDITPFLYLIGSVFAPMIAVQIADYFILKQDHFEEKCSVRSMLVWAAGFILYRLLMKVDLPLGNTLPDMLITTALAVLTGKLAAGKTDSIPKKMS
ncbi:MAG: putative hydroxymethylpyrimidine transporter CytX [Lachnospiraceae bacterium]|nr:putative hydroxymethylpyrimidine transporter CytX [Lachnospiraceae bacterium]